MLLFMLLIYALLGLSLALTQFGVIGYFRVIISNNTGLGAPKCLPVSVCVCVLGNYDMSIKLLVTVACLSPPQNTRDWITRHVVNDVTQFLMRNYVACLLPWSVNSWSLSNWRADM